MSKAFTRESDEASGEEMLPPRPLFPPGVKRYMTKAGAERLRQEANALVEEKRILLTAGKTSADALVKARRLEGAIQRIQQALDAVIVAGPPADAAKAGLGATVRVRDADGEEENYQIVGPDEAEPAQGRISASSPLAQALMNRRAGENVRFKSPAGEQEMKILSVDY